MNSVLTRSGNSSLFFKHRADLLDVERVHAVKEYDAVRVPHGNAGDVVRRIADRNRPVDDLLAAKLDRNLVRRQDCLTHVDLDRADLAAAQIQRQCL